MKNIGLILKNARERNNLTQKQVMELTGINRKSLSGYENNVAEPDLHTFSLLANLYGFSADDVLDIHPSVTLLTLQASELKILSLFKELDSQHQEELLILLNTLVTHLSKK